ncbi:hypothetical protein [Nitrosopumilus sp.]|uniref:hypothetical protein n=1 Tax=Nitrosopumilus sp. TaxID=2024843 RepID=UPI003D0D455D
MYKKRIIWFFVFMGMYSLIFQIGSMAEPTREEVAIFMKEFEVITGDIDAIGLFVHNTTISLPMFIPGIGAIWGLLSSWSTGFAFANLAVQSLALAETPALSILYYSPYGFMEIVAYSIAISRSFILILGIIKRNDLKTLLKPTGIEIAIVIGLLFAGGFLEHYMIEADVEMSEKNEPVTYSSELPKACDGVTSVETQLHPTGEECMKLLNEQIFVYCLSENNEDESIAQGCRAEAFMQMDQNCKENEESPYNTCMMTELKQAYQNMVPNQ